MRTWMLTIVAACAVLFRADAGGAAGARPAENYPVAPTLADVAYGAHPKQRLHFWKAESAAPTPLLFFIHGGGWTAGNRSGGQLAELLPLMLANGISVVSVEYRFIQEAAKDGEVPPVRGPMRDVARALQFTRSKSAVLNLDKAHRRVRRFGGRVFVSVAGVPRRSGRPCQRGSRRS